MGRALAGALAGAGHDVGLDLGPLSTARAAEQVLPLWLAVNARLGTASFSFGVHH